MITATAPRHERMVAQVAAGLVLASALVHLLLLDASSLGALMMSVMAVACLPCAWHLWRSPSGGVWAVAAAVDAAMLLLHAQMLATSGAGHHHAGGTAPVALMWIGSTLVCAQLLVAAGSLAIRTRSHRRNAVMVDS